MSQAPRPNRNIALLVALLAFAFLAALAGVLRLVRDDGNPRRRSLAEEITQAADRMSGPGSGGYRRPTAQETTTLQRLAGALVEGNLAAAEPLAEDLGYEVVPFHDDTSGNDLLIAREEHPTQRGWGTLVVAEAPAAPSLIVEAPHPVADRWTEDVAARAFLASGAQALLIAGANREALDDDGADVAHAKGSAFDALHRALVGPDSVVLQVHGYDATERDDSFGDAVLSSGTSEPGDAVQRLAGIMRDAGLEVCVYDGERCAGLGGTTNLQGRSTRAADAVFIHVELSAGLRERAVDRERTAALLGRTPA